MRRIYAQYFLRFNSDNFEKKVSTTLVKNHYSQRISLNQKASPFLLCWNKNFHIYAALY